MCIYLAGGLALAGVSRADGPIAPGNPYTAIADRNIFGLVPIPPPESQEDKTPPPKITVTGIMTIFGPREALFKVAGVFKAGRTQDESYILEEGQAQDDVEVMAIDEKKRTVTFNNHGVVQEIPLVAGVATGGSQPSGPTGGPGPTFGRRRGFQFGGGNPRSLLNNYQPYNGAGNSFNPVNGYNQANSYNGNAYNGYNSGSGINNLFGSPQNTGAHVIDTSYSDPMLQGQNISAEDQAALIAANHQQAIQQGSPTANLFPPTQFDEQAANEFGTGKRGAQNSPEAAPQQ